jgi:Fur family ferric uptake transcriptional regulator
MEQLEKIFRDKQLRLTEPRKDVFKVLDDRDQPMTIGEIIKESHIAERTIVYRTLQLFTKLGIVDIIQVGWKQRYELAEPFKAHHHHLICVKCGALVKIDLPKLEKIINKIGDSYNYELVGHHVELQGICKDCRA